MCGTSGMDGWMDEDKEMMMLFDDDGDDDTDVS